MTDEHADNLDDQFKIGVETVQRTWNSFGLSSRWSDVGVKVEKVYKNGNIKLEGQKGQWKVYWSSFHGWTASPTGSAYYRSNVTLYVLNDKTRALMEESEKERLQSNRRSKLTAEIKNVLYSGKLSLDQLEQMAKIAGIEDSIIVTK